MSAVAEYAISPAGDPLPLPSAGRRGSASGRRTVGVRIAVLPSLYYLMWTPDAAPAGDGQGRGTPRPWPAGAAVPSFSL
jgi:hypothetical protein